MLYYKVISNKFHYAFNGRYHKANIFSYRYKNGLRYSWQYIADELITPGELKKYYGITAENLHNFPFLQPVNINKNKTHFFFGARFEDNTPAYYTAAGEVFE